MDQQVSPAVVVIVLILIAAILVGLYFLLIEGQAPTGEESAVDVTGNVVAPPAEPAPGAEPAGGPATDQEQPDQGKAQPANSAEQPVAGGEQPTTGGAAETAPAGGDE